MSDGPRTPPMPTAVRLRDLTTLRVGGPAASVVQATTGADLVAAVSGADDIGSPMLLVGGGSNLLVGDEGWSGTVVQVATTGIAVEREDDRVVLDVAAGEDWDELAAMTVAEGWSGLECLSGIPGRTGASPVQNIGAYGAEVADVVTEVDVWDRSADESAVLPARACRFGYRTSVFKHTDRYVVVGVRLVLRPDGRSAPVRYAELAGALGVELGDRVPAAAAREAVLALRRGKGMVLDDDDPDTWSAGSFFTNPLVAADVIPVGAPVWPAGDLVKTSAAWLIEHAGFGRGFGADLGRGAATLSRKHTLAVTNRGDATAAEVVALARTVRDGVRDRFGIELRAEPRLVGCAL